MTPSGPDLFAALVAREAGAPAGLVPRLPAPFEKPPAPEGPDPAVASTTTPAPAVDRSLTAVPVATPASEAAPLPSTTGQMAERRPEVVHIEERVRVELREPEPLEKRPRPRRGVDPEHPPRPADDPATRLLVEPEPARVPAPSGDQVAALRPSVGVLSAPTPEPDAPARRDPAPVLVTVSRHEPDLSRHPLLQEPSSTSTVSEPAVHVSIGRVEVRAVAEPAAPRARRSNRRTETLDDYLERRNRGSGT